MHASIIEMLGLNFATHVKKKRLLPLLWLAVRSCFYTVSIKRTYLRHLNKREMRVSIVEMMSLNLDTHVKNRTFATALTRSRKLFLRCFAQAHSLTTLQEKNNARIDCRKFESEFCHTHKKQDFYHCYGRSRKLFLLSFAQAHSLTTLQEKSNARIDCRNAGFEFCHTRKKRLLPMLWLAVEAVFTLFRSSALSYDTKKKD